MPENEIHTEDANIALIREFKSGSTAALDELVSKNMGLVKSLSKRFIGRGTDYEDIVQLGTIGMIKAARSFDEQYGTAFSTYAVPLIIGEIRRYLRDDGMIKISRDLRRRGSVLMKAREAYQTEHQKEPKLSELAEMCEMTEEQAAEALDAVYPVCSLQDSVGDGDDTLTLEAVTPSRDNEIEKLTDIIALRQAVAHLDCQQRKIIALRYYKELSQQQTADILGITQVKVSREEKRIFAKLREELAK